MLPPMSNVPAVDNEFDFAWAKIAPMFVSCWLDLDVSCFVDASASPSDAEIMAETSDADLSITLRLKSLKSCN